MADKKPPKDDALSAQADTSAFDAETSNFKTPQQIIKDMRQQRIARWIALFFLVVFAAGTGIMMLSLWGLVYRSDHSLLRVFLDNNGHWPLGIFISGTFLSFIAACGGLALGAFTSVRRKRKEE